MSVGLAATAIQADTIQADTIQADIAVGAGLEPRHANTFHLLLKFPGVG